MKKLFTALILVGVVTVPLHAQGDVLVPKSTGSHTALLFSLHGLRNLGPWDFGKRDADSVDSGVGFGMKFFISQEIALRFGVGFTSTSVTEKLIGTGLSGGGSDITTAQLQSGERKTSAFAVGIMPGFEYHFIRISTVSGYIGAQAGFGTQSTTVEVDDGQGLGTTKLEMSGTLFGVGGFIGAEWFAFENVSLGAEYQLNFISSSGKLKFTDSGGTTESDVGPVTSLGLQSGTQFNFILAFYF